MSVINIFFSPTNKKVQMKKRLSAFQYRYDALHPIESIQHAESTESSSELGRFSTIVRFFSRRASYAGVHYSGKSVLCSCIILGVLGFFLGSLIQVTFGVFTGILSFYLPISYLHAVAERRSKAFSAEYPSILLAMASNMKAGLTVYSSLERAIALLPQESYVKQEVRLFLEKVSRGIPTEKAVTEFAQHIQLKELDLFRRAFALVIIHGGRFSRTLERLAQVTRDRENLINSSRVSTASMRMTSNVLLVVAPLLLFILSAKNKDFWPTLLHNHVAFTLGLVGSFTIGISIFVLRRMSDFKP